MLSKIVSRARPGAAGTAAPGRDKAGEVIHGFVAALERCEAALARPVRRRARRPVAGSLHRSAT